MVCYHSGYSQRQEYSMLLLMLLEWYVKQEGLEFLFHYLDHFAVICPPNSRACHHVLDTLKIICAELGVPLAPEKQAGPSTIITFLGIIIDTMKQELRLPRDKLKRLIETVSEWASSKRKWCTRRELESLIGVLRHATKVIHAGQFFMRRAIALLSVAKKDYHHIRLSTDFHSDMMWWKVFASSWNGCSAYTLTGGNDSTVTSDALGSWGCGAWHQTKWFQLSWDNRSQSMHILAKEMIPILLSAAIWGKEC